jgi:serine/threonine protein phosphatase PrpC
MADNVKLDFAVLTDVGKLREHNEDCVGFFPQVGLAVLADGMGGHNGGEVASQIAIRVVQDVVSQRFTTRTSSLWGQARRRMQELLVRAFREANAAIVLEAALQPHLAGMGTTLVAALFEGDRVTVAHVGDSRAYRIRQGSIVQLTKDHSLLQQQIDAGMISEEEAQSSSIRNLLTRAIGTDPAPAVEVHEHATEAGDVYLLCSDGLTDMLSDERILEVIGGRSTLTEACDWLIEEANREGGRDNISTILVEVML